MQNRAQMTVPALARAAAPVDVLAAVKPPVFRLVQTTAAEVVLERAQERVQEVAREAAREGAILLVRETAPTTAPVDVQAVVPGVVLVHAMAVPQHALVDAVRLAKITVTRSACRPARRTVETTAAERASFPVS